MKFKKSIIAVIAIISCLSTFAQITASDKKIVVPSARQVEWANQEIGVLIHFDMPVFKPEYEWRRDMGKHPDASVFNPSALDTDQWLKAAKSAGAKYAVLVAKHCSGFSLWPTKAHEYSVKNSPWKNGKGDLVADFIASCKKYGIKPGIYASTTANGYLRVDNPGKVLSGDPEDQKRYNKVVETQLTELWSQYGELFEIWFDGGVLPVEAGGADVMAMLKKYQPNAIAFQGPFNHPNNIRWVGNEEGVAPYPCWARTDAFTSASGVVEIKGLNGNPEGQYWCPGEADFPLRKNSSFQGGWFWKKGEDNQLFELDQLVKKYTQSVGRNSNMLLGIVIDDRGLVPDADVKRMKEFGEAISKHFGKALATVKRPIADDMNVFLLDLKQETPVSYVVFRENITTGEIIREYKLSGMTNGQWTKLAEGTCVGHKRIECVNGRYSQLKLEITKSAGPVNLLELSCF
ncbi:hypothetical protein D1614_19400 [Maribellus luteus]|uniref:alpha-L-fucosidase n=1 Tax=Maribellus luteus TaxID=2305463 RepID=A0A399SWJ0_9BACT|nr:alpha-L-fucosidase [Maribellus luteus]RIJ46367.1 hypothetical protein D1614_19400 [Maribellus luteus]